MFVGVKRLFIHARTERGGGPSSVRLPAYPHRVNLEFARATRFKLAGFHVERLARFQKENIHTKVAAPVHSCCHARMKQRIALWQRLLCCVLTIVL